MAHQITVSRPLGAGSSVTSRVITNLKEVKIDFVHMVLHVSHDMENKPRREEFQLSGATVLTDTITSDNHVLVVS